MCLWKSTIKRDRTVWKLRKFTPHIVLAITTKSPENKDFQILDFFIKTGFCFTLTLQGP